MLSFFFRMAQFVSITPTLMEAQHHHPPHYYHHPHHHKECHMKDCKNKDHDHHHKDHKEDYKEHKDVHHKESKEQKEKEQKNKDKDSKCHVKDCHTKDCEHSKRNSHHDKESLKSPPLSEDSFISHASSHQSRKGSQGHFYIDSHGFKHEYTTHFVDQQGICRESEVKSHKNTSKEEHQRENENRSLHSKSEHEIVKPVPPQFIDIQPMHVENKVVSTFSFLFHT